MTYAAAARTLAAALLAVLCAACAPAPEPGLTVTEARVRVPLPGQDKTAGYFTIHNGGAVDVVLTGASCADARTVEMHVTSRDGDMVRMRRLDEVVIPAGETVRFEPGGRHLMLFGVSPLGEATEIELQRAGGEPIAVRFAIIAMGEQ